MINAFHWLAKNRLQAVKSVKKLAGLTACSYVIQLFNGERYVLRHQTPRSSQYGINYQQEAFWLKQITHLALSPKVAYYDTQSSLLTWIEGKTATTVTPALQQQLATKLAQLHQFDLQAVAIPAFFAPLNLAQRCQFLWQQLPHSAQIALPFSPPFTEIRPFKRALCHHDIHLNNLILQGEKLFLIDWEYSAISDIALEISLYFHANPLTPDQKQHFLAIYCTEMNICPQALQLKIAEYRPEIEKLNRLWLALSQTHN